MFGGPVLPVQGSVLWTSCCGLSWTSKRDLPGVTQLGSWARLHEDPGVEEAWLEMLEGPPVPRMETSWGQESWASRDSPLGEGRRPLGGGVLLCWPSAWLLVAGLAARTV